MDERESNQKTQIFFSRTYRYFEVNKKEQLIYVLALIVPSVVLFLLFYSEISRVLAIWVSNALAAGMPEESVGVLYTNFLPIFGGVYHVEIPNSVPSNNEIWINLAVTMFLLVVTALLNKRKKRRTPLSIYFIIVLLIHLIACIYFLFAKDFFPYTATQYSELYIKQQVVIWLSFILLSGFVLGVIGYGEVRDKILFFLGVMLYSFVFGAARYLAFSYIISSTSSIYMATMFFSLGPLYDFLYFVFFYAVYINRKIKYFDYGEGRSRWQWS